MLRVAVLGIVVMSVGCAYPYYKEGNWPSGIPDQAYYENIYEKDEENKKVQTRKEYLSWAIGFFEGSSIIPGWKKFSKGFLKTIPDGRMDVMKAKLAYCAQLISGEWSKKKEPRRVSGKMLDVWVRILRKARKYKTTEQVLDQIIEDIISLLTYKIEPEVIKKSRYDKWMKSKLENKSPRRDADSN